MMSGDIEPFKIVIDNVVLNDLRRRLADTRWTDVETVEDWSQGARTQHVRALCDYWLRHYDWRRCEAQLNSLGQFRTVIDGLDIHFLHVRSRCAEAKPLILTHGWPSSVVEFLEVIAPLTDPEAHGGDARDAFHVVIPSLPGFGFSGKPQDSSWTLGKIALAWTTLMGRLGYKRYLAQGGDWGGFVTTTIGATQADHCAGIHLNTVLAFPSEQDMQDLTEAERASLAASRNFELKESGYFGLQSTKPQTLAYGLADSPVGQAAWIYEKFHGWADHDGNPETVLSRDAMLDNIMLYWLPGTAGSAARMYWYNAAQIFELMNVHVAVPMAASVFPQDMVRPSRRWAERVFSSIVHWNETAKGGHFAAFEQPRLFVEELRSGFRSMMLD
jgi:pimeloyl-ACP methyl ester carboxylesterase